MWIFWSLVAFVDSVAKMFDFSGAHDKLPRREKSPWHPVFSPQVITQDAEVAPWQPGMEFEETFDGFKIEEAVEECDLNDPAVREEIAAWEKEFDEDGETEAEADDDEDSETSPPGTGIEASVETMSPRLYESQELEEELPDSAFEEPRPASPPTPLKTEQDFQDEVLGDFHQYLNALDNADFDWAKDLREGFRESLGSRTKSSRLGRLLDQGKLKDVIVPGLIFQWRNDQGLMVPEDHIKKVPKEYRATSLLWALFEKQFPRPQKDVEIDPTLPKPVVNYDTGFRGRVTGKTEREKAKRKGPKPPRVGPAKGHNATPPKHGGKKKKQRA